MKNIKKKFISFIQKMFLDAFDLLKAQSIIVVNITDLLKSAVESDTVKFLVENTPTKIDDIVLEKLKIVIPMVAFKLAVMHGILQTSDNSSEAIDKLITHLKGLNPGARVSFWVMFSGELNMVLSDGKINLAESFMITQLVYNELKNRNK
jgi:hypothetical protein